LSYARTQAAAQLGTALATPLARAPVVRRDVGVGACSQGRQPGPVPQCGAGGSPGGGRGALERPCGPCQPWTGVACGVCGRRRGGGWAGVREGTVRGYALFSLVQGGVAVACDARAVLACGGTRAQSLPWSSGPPFTSRRRRQHERAAACWPTALHAPVPHSVRECSNRAHRTAAACSPLSVARPQRTAYATPSSRWRHPGNALLPASFTRGSIHLKVFKVFHMITLTLLIRLLERIRRCARQHRVEPAQPSSAS
jgi:hypothetical protein